jgi:ribose/xylose/arabinose/galactoside ABC-type transport system permease subunit
MSGAAVGAPEQAAASRSARKVILLVLQGLVALAGLVILVGAITTQGFFSVDNLKAILASVGFVGMVAVGMTVIMISGSFVSMSLGTQAAVSAIFFVWALKFGVAPAIAMTIAFGLIIGSIQGYAIGAFGANPIVLTIAVVAVLEGMVVVFSSGGTQTPPNGAYEFLNDTILGLPMSFYVMLGVVAVAELIMRRTTFGRQVYMVGDNPLAAFVAGLPMGKIGAGVFGLAGVASAVAGIMLGAYNQGASLLLTGSLTYDAIAATLVGGTLVSGGKGSVWKTLVGALVIATITDLLLLRGYSTGVQIMVKGLLVVVVVIVVHLRSQGTRS